MANDVWERLVGVIRDVLEDPDLELTPTTTADEVDEWDSMQHVNIVLGVEREFGVKFASSEIDSLRDVGALRDLVARHLQ